MIAIQNRIHPQNNIHTPNNNNQPQKRIQYLKKLYQQIAYVSKEKEKHFYPPF